MSKDHIAVSVNSAAREFWRYKHGADLPAGKEREAIALVFDLPVEDVLPLQDGRFGLPIRKLNDIARGKK